MGDPAAIGGLGGEGLVQMHRVEIVGRLGEQPNAVLRRDDDFLGRHADVKFVQDVTTGRMLLNQFDHG